MPSSIVPGLVSITFRQLRPAEIVRLVAQANLRSIEWGGDVHVPHGEVATAEQVRRMTADAGLVVSAYGSYYRLAGRPEQTPPFEAVLDCALALGARAIRVWAGTLASDKADGAHREAVAADLARIARLAGQHGVTVDLEYHGGTLTDTPESTAALLAAVPLANVRSYWQPRHGLSVEQHLVEIALLRPRLANVHVFHWWPDPGSRWPLEDGRDRWARYLSAVDPTDGNARHASLEFVRGDDPQQFRADAATLRNLLEQAG